MNRRINSLTSFGVSALLHGLLVLGMIWFWSMRPPDLRPRFQGGDVSLAVTFVVEAEGEASEVLSATSAGKWPLAPLRGDVVERRAAADNVNRKTETAAVLTDRNTEMPEDGSQTPDTRRPTTDSAAETLKDQDIFDQAIKAQALADMPEAPADAPRQGVSVAARMQADIRPYYPIGARLRGEEGIVTVRVWVKPSGHALRCEVARSSGYPVLDQAAMDAARRARYVSTRPGIWRAETETMLTFRFRLTG
jgi:TonB family protein